MSARRAKTPMEEQYPNICEWVRHGTVITDHLRAELEKALVWIDSGATHADELTMSMEEMTALRQSIFVRSQLRAEARASIALDKGDGQTFALDDPRRIAVDEAPCGKCGHVGPRGALCTRCNP